MDAPVPRFRRELTDGLRIVVTDPLFRTLTLGSAAFNAGRAAQYVLGLPFLKELDTPTAFYGVLARGPRGGPRSSDWQSRWPNPVSGCSATPSAASVYRSRVDHQHHQGQPAPGPVPAGTQA